MKVIVLRHGQASWSAPLDFERELTDQGVEEVSQTVALLKACGVTDLYASPYRRAQQTAEIASAAVGCPVRTLDSLVPEGRPGEVVRELPDQGTILLASHMPLVGSLTAYLCEGTSSAGPVFTTAMALVLEMDILGPGMARVVAQVPY